MSDAPKCITRFYDGDMLEGSFKEPHPLAKLPRKEYRRADLPPTPEHIAADPRVQALVEALGAMRRQFSPYPSENTERWREEHEACEQADAALAEFTTTTTTKETT
jgi:hypothetical protein